MGLVPLRIIENEWFQLTSFSITSIDHFDVKQNLHNFHIYKGVWTGGQ